MIVRWRACSVVVEDQLTREGRLVKAEQREVEFSHSTATTTTTTTAAATGTEHKFAPTVASSSVFLHRFACCAALRCVVPIGACAERRKAEREQLLIIEVGEKVHN